MHHGYRFDRENEKDRKRRHAEEERRAKEQKTRETLNEAAPDLLAACEIFTEEVFDDEKLWSILDAAMGEKYTIWLSGIVREATAAIAKTK